MRRRCLLVLAMGLLVASCSSQTAETTIASDAPVAEPIDLNALAEVLLIDEAEHFRIERSIRACMTETGFDYNIGWYFPVDLFEHAPWRVVASPPPEPSYSPEEVDEFRRTGDALALSQLGWTDALFGTEREYTDLGSGGGLERFVGGCLDQGWATVVGDTSAWHELFGRVQGVQGEAYAKAKATSAALSANDVWASCVRARGFDASSPDDSNANWQETPGAQEAFSACMDESGLDTVVGGEQASVVGVLLQENAHTLNRLLQRIGGAG